MPVFKIVFNEKQMIKKKDIVPESNEASLAQINPADLEEVKGQG